MELARYLAGTDSVIGLLSPRWIRSNVISDMVSQYLEGKGYKVSILTSDVIHQLPVQGTSNTPLVNIYIYETLIAATMHPIPAKMAGAISIVIIEWGFDYKLLEQLALRNNNRIRYLALKFLHSPRSVSFNMVKIPITSDYATWYAELTNATTSIDVKAMAGNHYYRSMPPNEAVNSLVNAGKYTYDENIIHDSGDFDAIQALDNVKKVTNEVHISHVGELAPEEYRRNNIGVGVYKNPNATIASDSPKIHQVVREFAKGVGKILIVTSFRFSYGMTLFQKLLTNIFGTSPLVIDPTQNKEVSSGVIEEFNNSENSILITSTIPDAPLKDVSRMFVMDDYNPNFIIHCVYNLCMYKCGSGNGPLTVTLLTVSVPSFISENTYEVEQSRKCMEVLSIMNRRYDAIESSSIPVVIEETDFNVLDNLSIEASDYSH